MNTKSTGEPGKGNASLKASQPVETNYEKHHADPAPAEEAVFEEDKNGASKTLKWVIPVVIAVLIILWFFIK